MRRLLAVLFVFLVLGARAEEMRGKVIGVSDGDNLTLLSSGNQQHKIRLSCIDAPERGQDFSTKAKQGLSYKVYGEQIRLVTTGKDKYGRTLGTVFLGEENVNLWMVAEGLAWHYASLCPDDEYAQRQAIAKAAAKGLWSIHGAIPPWEFRTRKALRPTTGGSEVSPPTPKPPQPAALGLWLNTSSGTRHNQSCQWYKNTKRGRMCSADEGKACGICGG